MKNILIIIIAVMATFNTYAQNECSTEDVDSATMKNCHGLATMIG